MKVKNPNYDDPILAQIDNYKTHFVNYTNSLPTTQEWISFDDIRAHFNKTEEQFPDGLIAEILTAIGIDQNDIQHNE